MSTIISVVIALILAVLSIGVVANRSSESEATPPGGWAAYPAPAIEATGFVFVERAEAITNLDLGEAGPSAGDMIIWGPNALFDEANVADTGATTQGFCVALDATGTCKLTETILFADGSTIELQGIQAAGSGESTRTMVGGSGDYLGATGTVFVQPTDDLTIWKKTFDITM